MATINAIAHLNELTKDVTDDYYLTAEVRDTLTPADIVKRLSDREIATKNVDGLAFTQAFLDECAAASAEGYNIVTSFFRSSIGIQGVVYAKELGHNIPAERLKVSVNLTQGDTARKAVADAVVHAYEQAGATGPVIQSVTDPTENKTDHLNPGSMALIQGMRLSVKGDNPAVGIRFNKESEPSGAGVLVPAAKISPNTPTKLQFVLPAEVTAGNWWVTVTTQASSNRSELLKEPRSYQYQKLITVGAGDDSDSPDEI